ncbi:class III lanthionine synthetase LanKC [Stackebrandtia nassauensis]|uniref:non-specific serine/threonine protein kinase n=1 Tax=Stackebrandtia nassauensis (strain DSM 44728 / CIP 108903 / NRRL B-16338 / NBRC 102104 / LLR-40K-21) TaxID=446470 RepID=D3Q5U7_STANL|nr:class III lanthionine synthetase LanKC [Stackebrandtia nassauensis]ADD40246.1 serine/threonine protein kinase [Stackebrandtia nassauensis DSM 44728]
MDEQYEAFCMADSTFYDAMYSAETAGVSFPVAERELSPEWHRSEQDDWLVFRRPDREIPGQGWKIHASASMESAQRVLEEVWDYCVPRGIAFKFLRSPNALLVRVSKYAPRGYSGKLVTIYPADIGQCETILNELGARLEGVDNPYVLSDLRWGTGPLHVRYGAFANQYTVDENGQTVEAILDGDGKLVADDRGPVFRIPEWETLPEFLQPHLEARNAVTVAELPYAIDGVLHFSNGGGIYRARDTRDGKRVVLKEGRPHAGLDGKGRDAVQRVEHEYNILKQLSGIEGVPEVYDLFWLGEHRFLAMEYVEGEVLSKAIVLKYPLIDPGATEAEFATFTDWALEVHNQVSKTIAEIHARDVVYGDLHLFNIIVDESDRIRLLDFEVADAADSAERPALGNQGFTAPRDIVGPAADRYSLACLQLALFMPMTNLLGLHRLKARHFVEIITAHFPVPDGYFREALDQIAPATITDAPIRIEPETEQWPRLRDDLAKAIVASATPQREDRLFPGDVQQFAVGGLGLGYGAAGVLYALSVTGAGRHERFEDWLIDRSLRPVQGTRLGLYDGLNGAAFTLDHLGHRQAALDVVDIFLAEKWESLNTDLASGLAGAGLNLLHLAGPDEPELVERGLRCAELVAADIGELAEATDSSGGGEPWAGLMRGDSGRALLMLRAYAETGDPGFLDRAETALRRDLKRCVTSKTGALEVNERWRSMPYLEAGSVGIGLVLRQYLRVRHDEELAQAAEDIDLAAQSPMYILPGLYDGRAGILLYLAETLADPLSESSVRRQVRALSWHALPYADGVAFPGNGLLRLSMDLATGGAGVLLALGAVLHDQPVHAPLLTLKDTRGARRE